MIPYLLLAATPIGISLFYKDININNKRKRKFLIICGIILFLFMGLRSRFLGSGDSLNYYNTMKKAIECSSWTQYYNSDGVEIGFQFFVFILSRLFDNAQALIIASSAIYAFGTCYFIYHNSKDVTFSVVMYITLGLMTFHMQGMRQSIAMSILVLAYELLKKKKYFWFILAVGLATLFHSTAFVFLVLLIVPFLKNLNHTILFSTIIGGAIIILSDQLINIANDILDTDYSVHSTNVGGIIATSIYVLIVAFALIFNKSLSSDKQENAIFFVTFVGAICYLVRYFGALAAERISFYFMFGQISLLPNTLEFMKPRDKMVTKVVVYLLMIALFVYRLKTNGEFLPFDFFWND